MEPYNARKAVILLKRPLRLQKKRYLILYIFKLPPSYSKKILRAHMKRSIFFFGKSLMRTPLDSIIFTQFFFHLGPRAQGGIQMKILFGTIEDRPI